MTDWDEKIEGIEYVPANYSKEITDQFEKMKRNLLDQNLSMKNVFVKDLLLLIDSF